MAARSDNARVFWVVLKKIDLILHVHSKSTNVYSSMWQFPLILRYRLESPHKFRKSMLCSRGCVGIYPGTGSLSGATSEAPTRAMGCGNDDDGRDGEWWKEHLCTIPFHRRTYGFLLHIRINLQCRVVYRFSILPENLNCGISARSVRKFWGKS